MVSSAEVRDLANIEYIEQVIAERSTFGCLSKSQDRRITMAIRRQKLHLLDLFRIWRRGPRGIAISLATPSRRIRLKSSIEHIEQSGASHSAATSSNW